MPRKPNKEDVINNASMVPEDAYVTWGEDLSSKQEALKKSSASLDEFTGIQNSTASYGPGRRYSVDFSNLDGNTGSRPGLTRNDYYAFRPDESIPKKIKLIIYKAEDIYQRVGLVKNVIDLMGDFAVQGVRLVHENKRIEKFYKTWFKKINGKDRSERFLNNLYKTGNIIIHKQTAKISLKVTKDLYKSVGAPDLKLQTTDTFKIEKKEIPWKYTFIDPIYVECAGGSLSSFVSNKRYELILPAALRKTINSPKTESEKQVISTLPSAIIEAAKTRKPYPLDPSKTLVFHYKKDDWQAWAYPMIYAIMDDITVIEKLKLADMAALDGAISNIRIFKLGNLEHKIAPTKAATAKLAQILGNNVGGGTMDLVWGPDIELLESNTNVHNFLGEGKYTPHLNAIYAGLGIPPTLTGTFGAAGTTNNFISLKTLTQRLQYGRDILIKFWESEIEIIQKAMGFKYPAKIEFDRMDLSNEEAEKALLIQLVDRNLISDELLQSRFGLDADMEKSRLNREKKDRESNKMVKKAGPWYDPQFDNALKKLSLQLGLVTPSQVGLDLPKKKSNEKTALEMKADQSLLQQKQKMANDPKDSLPKEAGDGRPKLSKDTEKRQQKTFSPQTGAKLLLWSSSAQEKISSIINPIILEYFDKPNLRALSNTESNELDNIKTNILFSLKPFDKINQENIISHITSNNLTYTKNFYNWLNVLRAELSRELTVDEIKQAKSSFYSLVYTNQDTIN
jgi:hypothetical protein